MNKVIIISLGGRAYQLEEGAYDKVRAYLEEAARRLAADPGKAEILSDLELALAEKCERFLSPAKTVVSGAEAGAVLAEMGQVESSVEGGEAPSAPAAGRAGIRRFYRIREEAYVGGVCAGIAAYLGLDPTVVRIAFVLLLLFTSGAWLAAYILMMLLVPAARTEEQKAAAYGEPFTAREWVTRAKAQAGQAAPRNWRTWLGELAAMLRSERRERRSYVYPHGRFSPFSLLLVLAGAAASLVWLAGIARLMGGGAVFGCSAPAGVPLWAALVGWSLAYSLVVVPLRLLRRGSYLRGGGEEAVAAGYGRTALRIVLRIMLWTALICALLHYMPGVRAFLENLSMLGGDMRALFAAH